MMSCAPVQSFRRAPSEPSPEVEMTPFSDEVLESREDSHRIAVDPSAFGFPPASSAEPMGPLWDAAVPGVRIADALVGPGRSVPFDPAEGSLTLYLVLEGRF